MRLGKFALASLALSLGLAAGAAQARVRITIDIASQTMHVVGGAGETYDWKISTGKAAFPTPVGVYGVSRLEANHRSKKYNNAPMPHSIFFQGGYAIHGSYDLASLGRPASHGCVRLEPANAAQLYAMVEQEGAIIAVKGTWTGSTRLADQNKDKDKGQGRAAASPLDPPFEAAPPPAKPANPPPAGPLDLFSAIFR